MSLPILQKCIYKYPIHGHENLPFELNQLRVAAQKNYIEINEQVIHNFASHSAQEEKYHKFCFPDS